MAEIYRNAVNKGLTFSIPAADATVTSAVILRDATPTVTPTAVIDGMTSISIPFSITKYDGKFDIEWTFTIGSEIHTSRETHQIVTPLFTIAALRQEDPDFNNESDSSIIFLESLIRSLFYTLTGQKFGLENNGLSFVGTGGSAVSLPKRSAEPQGPLFGDGPGRAVVTSDGWMISKYQTESWIDKFEPNIFGGAPNTFLQGQRYYVNGLWGYYSVPEDITMAAILLAQDYGCEQSLWRDRYMKSVRMADMRFEMDGRAFIRTGNVKVDQILDRYARVRMVVL